MAFSDTTWYCNFGDGVTTGYYGVVVWQANTVTAAGTLRRQTAPALNDERVFIAIVGGTTHATTEPTWVVTRGGKTTDNTVTWQECTGESGMNGDVTNTPNWTTVKNTSVTLGQIIKRDNAASYQICSTAGTAGNGAEPAFSNTAGVTTADNTITWTSLGVVGNFTGGQAPHARLQNAVVNTWFAVGNTVFVGDNHAETQAAAMFFNGAAVNAGTQQNRVICHDHLGPYPPTSPATGATLSTTGANSIQFGSNNMGGTYWYGMTFKAGSGASGANITFSIQSTANTWIHSFFDNCSFQLNNTNAGSLITVGVSSVPAVTIWNNCRVKFGNIAQFIALQGQNFYWKNGAGTSIFESGSSIPSTLFGGGGVNANNYNATLEGLDLSLLTTNITMTGQLGGWNFLIKDCKLSASLTPINVAVCSLTIQYIRCDSGGALYKSSRYKYEGTETTETTITRVGSLPEPAANQIQSRKIVTTANSIFIRHFTPENYAVWNNTVGSNVTLTVYGTINSASVPNNDDIWLEIEFLGDSGNTLGSYAHTTKANVLSTGVPLSADGSTWNGGGSGVGWSPFKMSTTFTPQGKGWIFVRPRVAKPSTTYYLDPVPVLS